MKKVVLAIILLVLAVCWMMIIYNLSSMNGERSDNRSTGIIAIFIEDTLTVTNEYGITNSYPSNSQLARVSELINAPIRKVMHASVYLVLSFLIILFINVLMSNKHYWIALIITIIISVSFAISDEYHQTFVDGRAGQLLDVCIDSAGATVGMFVYTTYYIVYKNGYKKAKKEAEIQN